MDLLKSYEASVVAQSELVEICEQIYKNNFGNSFEIVSNLRDRFKDFSTVISDAELELIIISLPIKMIDISEKLNNVKIQYEGLKFGIKDKQNSAMLNSEQRTQAAKKLEAEDAVKEDKLLLVVYSTLIDRVENELSICKELIMGSKKVWDARKQTYNINPIHDSMELNEYNFSNRKQLNNLKGNNQ